MEVVEDVFFGDQLLQANISIAIAYHDENRNPSLSMNVVDVAGGTNTEAKYVDIARARVQREVAVCA